jgi:hypothetical protein
MRSASRWVAAAREPIEVSNHWKVLVATPVLVANQNHGRVGMEAWHDWVGIIRAALCVWYSYSHIFLLRRYAAGRVH